MALLESLQHDYHDAGQGFEIRGGVTRPVSGRPRALRRCLSNLLDNAIRYGRQPSIEVEERARELAIRVLDEGPGMPEAELERAFEPFVRGESSRSRETGGTGLGLAIVKHALARHQALLEIESTPGKGSTFSVRFPPQRLLPARVEA
jgi:signal transduction histidine kinase